MHPSIGLWGKEWLDSGFANCRITSPLYDEELFEVKSNIVDETHAHTTLIRRNGVVSANAEIKIIKNLKILKTIVSTLIQIQYFILLHH